MEESRLKPMVANYNPTMFKDIYGKTEGLRRKLAAGIDHRRFGVDYEELLSWFTVKFIYAYNKYQPKFKKNPEVLKAHMIKSMQLFKCRILRKAYTTKFSQSILPYEDHEHELQEALNYDPNLPTQYEFYSDKLRKYMKINLSDNAFILFQIQLNPPPYIIEQLRLKDQHDIHKIPDDLIAEYFDLGFSIRAYNYLDSLKREIKTAIANAKRYFEAEHRAFA